MIRNFLTIFICLIGFLLPFQGTAQYCATRLQGPVDFDVVAFEQFKRNRPSTSRSRARRKIGITFHVVQGTVDGANIDITKLYDEIDLVNNYFSAAGIEFFLCGAPRIIIDKTLYTYDQADRQLNTRFHHEPNTINIFYVDEIGDQITSSACGISTFPFKIFPTARERTAIDRFIIMQKDCSTNGTVLAHELGHFFGLYHTHERLMGVEAVNGSNCTTAGDQVCDTPADPNLGNIALNGCLYEGNFVDANGDRYNPDPSNIMSYAPFRCTSRFSPEQNERMNFFLETTDLAELITDCDFFPDFAITPTSSSATVISSGQILTVTYQLDQQGVMETTDIDITFSLQAMDSPLNFTIQSETITIEPGDGSNEITFNIDLPIEYSSGNYTLTTSLDPKSKIQEQDKRNNFLQSNLIIDNSRLSDRVLFPNPTSNQVKVFYRSRGNTGDINLLVSDYLGRVYKTEKKFKGTDEFSTIVDVQDLPSGLYVLTLNFIRTGDRQSYSFYKE